MRLTVPIRPSGMTVSLLNVLIFSGLNVNQNTQHRPTDHLYDLSGKLEEKAIPAKVVSHIQFGHLSRFQTVWPQVVRRSLVYLLSVGIIIYAIYEPQTQRKSLAEPTAMR